MVYEGLTHTAAVSVQQQTSLASGLATSHMIKHTHLPSTLLPSDHETTTHLTCLL